MEKNLIDKCIMTFSLFFPMFVTPAGADIKEMSGLTFQHTLGANFLESWSRLSKAKKPTIAAVNGFAVRPTLNSCYWVM